jgi:hypothetical protein
MHCTDRKKRKSQNYINNLPAKAIIMGKGPSHKTQRVYKPKHAEVKCGKQFPDCPPEPEEVKCKGCPLWKK